ncbi:MAG TPA: hypothetical protein VMS38_01900 [Pseudorhodoferax sp.]|nr:hypothetical protein [Pseudorhodoferax sp.]
MKSALSTVMLTLLVVAAGLAAYHHWVLRPALRVGVVDLAEVYRAKEAQFTQLLTRSASEDERSQAMGMARDFSQRLPGALEELPQECGCLVVLRTAVAGAPHAVDLTPLLRRKVGLP